MVLTDSYYIYILECQNNSFYIGYTTDICRRYQEHCDGSPKCKYTRAFPPKRLAVCWQFHAEVGVVLSLEASLKKLTKKQKLILVDCPNSLKDYTDLVFTQVELQDLSEKNINHK